MPKPSGVMLLVLTVLVALLAMFLYRTRLLKEDSPIVRTAQGQLQGYVARSRTGAEYYAYLGIPYAKPPVGELRFEPPHPPEPWPGVRDAKSYGSQCLQFDIMVRMTGGEEDCLFLNVFTSKTPQSTGRAAAVMIYFYGGLFTSGASNMYPPAYFMDEPDLVLVTLNYRVGALGFLNTGDGVVRGNMGLKDQVAALRWVQASIGAFGGDPARVTIFGESAGGAGVHYQMISPLSKGLFHKAISQSGTALAHWALYNRPREQSQRFAKNHGCSDNLNSLEMADCLRKVDGHSLVESHREMLRPLRDWITIFNPTVEQIDDENAFLAKEPTNMLKDGRLSNDVPWISGVNSHEGLMAAVAIFRNESMAHRIETEFDTAASHLFEVYPENSDEIKALRQFYKLGINIEVSPPPPDLKSPKFKAYTDIFSDRMFNSGLYHSARLRSGTKAPMYVYYYTHSSEVSIADFMVAAKGRFPVILEVGYAFVVGWIKRNVFGMKTQQFDGPCHADEMGMFFPMPWDRFITPSHPDYEFSRDLVKLWADFAKNEGIGKDTRLEFRGVEWTPVAASQQSKGSRLKYLQLDPSPKIIDEPFSERVQFWDKLGIPVQ